MNSVQEGTNEKAVRSLPSCADDERYANLIDTILKDSGVDDNLNGQRTETTKHHASPAGPEKPEKKGKQDKTNAALLKVFVPSSSEPVTSATEEEGLCKKNSMDSDIDIKNLDESLDSMEAGTGNGIVFKSPDSEECLAKKIDRLLSDVCEKSPNGDSFVAQVKKHSNHYANERFVSQLENSSSETNSTCVWAERKKECTECNTAKKGNGDQFGKEPETPCDSTAEEEKDSKRCSPNRPHPALEYPPLYFALRRCPWLFERSKQLYAFRWRLSYPLQRMVPFTRALRKMGIYLTWGELILLLPFFSAVIAGVLYTAVYPSVKVSGKVARFSLIAALVFANRNSLVTLLLGIPVDRGLFYHKLAGRIAFITGILHTLAFFLDPPVRDLGGMEAISEAFTGSVNISGSVLMLLISAISLTALPAIRRRVFEVFYYLHVVFTAGMVACAFFHSGILVPILGALTWGVDLFIRSIIMARSQYPRKARLKAISDTVVELSFPKTAAFAYNPGQYIYLAIPEISWLQWHPLSPSSSPKQRVVMLHIRKAGNWTSALFDLAQKQEEVSILIEGPYGNLSVDIMGDRYKNILFISGGIGITPMQSICDQLLYEQAKNKRSLNRLKFLWTERDPVLMQEAAFVKRTSSMGSLRSIDLNDSLSSGFSDNLDESEGKSTPLSLERNQESINKEVTQILAEEHSIDIASHLLALVPPGKTTDRELDVLYDSGDLCMDEESISVESSEDNTHVAYPRGLAAGEISSSKRSPISVIDDETSFADNASPWMVEAPAAQESLAKVLSMEIYLTGDSPLLQNIPFAKVGRPDIKKIFSEMKQDAIASGDKRVAVCVSAPPKLMTMCRKACVVYSDDRVRFDFHGESISV